MDCQFLKMQAQSQDLSQGDEDPLPCSPMMFPSKTRIPNLTLTRPLLEAEEPKFFQISSEMKVPIVTACTFFTEIHKFCKNVAFCLLFRLIDDTCKPLGEFLLL